MKPGFLMIAFSILLVSLCASQTPEGGFTGAAEIDGGKFLIATPALRDPNFFQSVVLLLQHSKAGTMGLVINHPSEIKLQDAFSKVAQMRDVREFLFRGGPVSPGEVFFLVRGSADPKKEIHSVLKEVCVSGNLDAVLDRVSPGDWNKKVRAIAGYSGWQPRQLQMEIVEGNWNLLDADAQTIFDHDPTRLWQELRRRTSLLQARNTRAYRSSEDSLRQMR
jgi:putative transcriptional regulator